MVHSVYVDSIALLKTVRFDMKALVASHENSSMYISTQTEWQSDETKDNRFAI